MSDIPSRDTPEDGIVTRAGQGPGGQAQEQPARRGRRGLRIALVSAASLVVILGAVVAGGYAYVNHLVGSVPRISVRFMKLDVAGQRSAAKGSGAMTVLITGAWVGPTGLPALPSGASSGSGLVRRIAAQLWSAVRQDSLAAFTRRYPFTVTPAAPR